MELYKIARITKFFLILWISIITVGVLVIRQQNEVLLRAETATGSYGSPENHTKKEHDSSETGIKFGMDKNIALLQDGPDEHRDRRRETTK